MENEVMVQEKQEIVSPFADPESFQNIFNIGKMWASSELVPQAYRGKPMDCTIAVDMANRMGGIANDGYAEFKCCQRKSELERTSVYDLDSCFWKFQKCTLCVFW